MTPIRNKKADILDVAAQLFWANGYENTSVKDICEACGFFPGNLYNYFPTKEDLLYEAMKLETGRFIMIVVGNPEFDKGSSIDQMRHLIKSHVRVGTSHQVTSGILLESQMKSLTKVHRDHIVKLRDTYQDALTKVIRAGIKSGDFREVDEKIATFAILAILTQVRSWYSPSGRLSSDEIGDVICDLVLHSLQNCSGD